MLASGWSSPSIVGIEFRNSRVNVHGPLNDRIRRPGIHHVKDRVDGLVATSSEDGSSEDLA